LVPLHFAQALDDLRRIWTSLYVREKSFCFKHLDNTMLRTVSIPLLADAQTPLKISRRLDGRPVLQ
jgi:hypothetical protein